MSGKKVLASLGAILVIVLPIVGHTAYAHMPSVHLALDISAAVLGFYGFTISEPLFGSSAGEPK